MERKWPLIGRDTELSAVAAAVRTSGGLVLAGPAGVGKTRLAREAASLASHRGLHVLWVQGSLVARDVPLGAFAGLVDLAPGDASQVVPRTLAALRAEGALLLVVDDAQLLDALSALVLQRVVTQRLASVVVTVRVQDKVPDAVTALWKDDHLRRLEIAPLDESSTGLLVAQVLGGPVESATLRRLFALTQGSPLFLSHLLRGEVAAGRLSPASGLWSWHAEPRLSAELATIVADHVGDLADDARDVIDLVSLGEPVALAILTELTSEASVESAEGQGLVRVERAGADLTVRLAHPLYGEVRRRSMGVLRARRLRGLLVRTKDGDLLHRAVLALDSDLPPDHDMMLDAAKLALELYDPVLAERLVAGVDEFEGRLVHASTLSWLGRGEDAEAALAALVPLATTTAERELVSAYRAGNLFFTLGRDLAAMAVLDQGELEPAGPAAALRTSLTIAGGDVERGLVEVPELLRSSEHPDGLALLLLASGQAAAAAVSGRVDLLEEAAHVVTRNPQGNAAGIPAFGLGDWRVLGHRLAGGIDEATRVAEDLHAASMDLPGPAPLMGLVLAGHAALAAGRVRQAVRLLTEASAGLTPTTHEFGYRCLTLLATAHALAGDPGAATPLLEKVLAGAHPAYLLFRPDDLLAQAWGAASQGAVSVAREHAAAAADLARRQRSPAYEVYALQVATQLGGLAHGPGRLRELTGLVDGPRAAVAAAHSGALAEEDGSGLDAVATRWAELGDLLAAGDAAAQAAQVHHHGGRHGSALVSAARASQWAEHTGARTPALAHALRPLPLTEREREVVTLAAQGLSNRAIATRLVVSVRTIEGHLYRAGHKLGVSDRADLAGLLGVQAENE